MDSKILERISESFNYIISASVSTEDIDELIITDNIHEIELLRIDIKKYQVICDCMGKRNQVFIDIFAIYKVISNHLIKHSLYKLITFRY